MDPTFTQSTQTEVFKDIIDEFKKTEPCDERIKECMSNLNLEYQEDQFSNMQSVLTALSFKMSPKDFS